jgi:putative salt-induced outer membrane protein YdiY
MVQRFHFPPFPSPCWLLLVAAILLIRPVHAAEYGELQLLPPVAPSIPPAADVGLQIGNTLPPPAEGGPLSPPIGGAPEELLPQAGVPRVPEEILPAPPVMGPAWYQPQYWLPAPVWSGSIELGLNGSSGNSDTLSTKAGYKLKRKTEFHLFKSNLNYVQTESGSIQTQHNALLKSDYERLFTDSPWSLFVNSGVEYDEFKPFDLRVSVNSGLAYAIVDNDITKLKTRFGAGASQEIGGANDEVSPEAAFGFDYEHELTSRQSISATMDYYPNWTDFADYRMVTDLGWQVLLDEASNLSLKVGVVNRYDSTPGNSLPNDVNYSVLLLWKL